LQKDPDNALISRFPMRRMEAEMVRDSLLKVSSRLDTRRFGPPEGIEATSEGEVLSKAVPTSCAGGVCVVPAFQSAVRRSIYTLQRRDTHLTLLEAFDAPYLEPNSLKRGYSTVPTQALQLMNGGLIRQTARYFSGRVMDEAGANVEQQVEHAYIAALSRLPQPEELKAAAQMIQQATAEWKMYLDRDDQPEPRRMQSEWLGLASFCHVLLNSPDFLYID